MIETSGPRGPGSAWSLRAVVRMLVLGLVVLVLVEAAAGGAARYAVSRAQRDLSDRLGPTQQAAQQLYRAFVDEETGQRGFLLTGQDQFLEPYAAGQEQVASLELRLRSAVTDAGFQSALAAAVTAGERWRTEAAEPEIAARRSGALQAADLAAMTARGKQLFDDLRIRLDAVSANADRLVRAEFDAIATAQRTADIISVVVILLAVAVAVAAPLILRRSLSRPLASLMAQLAVASGDDRGRAITADGPAELRVIAAASERMRAALVRNTADLVGAERQLTLVGERERMAADLRDHTIQQVFGLGLALSSAAGRAGPAMRAALDPLIEETDEIIRRLRTVIFDIEASDSGSDPRTAALD